MTTVGNYPSLAAAQVAQSFLLGNGIAAEIPDQFLAGVDWEMGTAIQGVRLQVAPDEAETARQLLEDSSELVAEHDKSASDLPASLVCPLCGSDRIGPSRWKQGLKAAGLLAPFLLLLWPVVALLSKRFQCASCHYAWG